MESLKLLYLIILSSQMVIAQRLSSSHVGSKTCEPIKIDYCRNIGYNMTGMPNLANNILQADAKMELEGYSPLFTLECANEVTFFLCSVYVPFCNGNGVYNTLIGPCRPMCERVKSGCLHILEKVKLPWPEKLNCSKFPERNGKQMCMAGPGEHAPPARIPYPSINDIQTNPMLMEKVKEELDSGVAKKLAEKYNKPKEYLELLNNHINIQQPAQGVNHNCNKFKKSPQYHFIQRTEECIPSCKSDIAFSQQEKTTAKILTISISATCFIVSLISLLTLMIDEHCCGFAESSQSRSTKNSVAQFAYTVPPFFSTFCCVFYSFGYLLSQLINPEDYCLQKDEDNNVLLTARDGHRNLPCIVIYLLVFFFGSAISTWWTVTAVSWCVALTSSTSSSSNQQRNSSKVSTICHAYAWGIPAALTVAGIIAHQVESDELLSVCLPGAGFKDESLLIFILIPEIFQVVLGLLFYVVGIVLATMKKSSKQNDGSKRAMQDTKTVDMLQNRVLMYGAIYIIMKITTLVTIFYEYTSRWKWLSSNFSDEEPITYIFFLRIATSQLVGLLCLCWVCRGSSLKSWQNCCKSCLCLWTRQNKSDSPAPEIASRQRDYSQVAYHQQNQVDNATVSIQPAMYNRMHGNL